MSEKKVSNPTYKNGVKTLTETQIKNGLPGYDLLKKKIEIIRENASSTENWSDNGLFENLKYDNIFSILGGRGAGKTSILFTLYHYLKSDNSQKNKTNILMPLIMPELIDNSDNFIGWILAAVEKNLDVLETELKKYGYSDDNSGYSKMCEEYKFFERCIFNDRNKLRKTFEDLKKAYYSKIYNSRRGEWDYSSDLELVSNINSKGFELVQKFTRYWDKLVEVNKKFNEHKGLKNEEPLIFFMIDDADLKPQIINELIFGLPKFFSHPNVVVIISASQKILNYTVKNFMYQQITKREFDLTALMNIEYQYNYKKYLEDDESSLDDSKIIKFHDLRYGREYDKIKNLTDEILRKIFPVCNRFYLKKYERYEEKCSLRFESNDSGVVMISKQFSSKLLKFKNIIINLHNQNIDADYPEYPNETIIREKIYNFKLLNAENNDISCPIYLSFLGIYPRDIVSNYYALCDMLSELISALERFYEDNRTAKKSESASEILNEFITNIYDACIKFINSAISSNRNLKPFCRNFNSLILKQKLHWQLFVNYEMIMDVMCKKKFFADNKEHPDNFIEMFCLMNFVEQLIFMVFPKRKAHHGHVEFCNFLDKCNIQLVKRSDDLDYMLKQYFWFRSSNVLPNFDKLNPSHQEIFLDISNRFDLIPIDTRIDDLLENKNWYDLYSEVVYYQYSNISKIKKHKNQLFILNESDFVDDKYQFICNKYYSQLHANILGQSSRRLKKANLGFVEEFATMALALDEKLNSLTIEITDKAPRRDTLQSFEFELRQADNMFELKRAFNAFINFCENNNYKVNRTSFISSLNSIQLLLYVENTNDFVYITSWYRRLVSWLKNSFIFVSDSMYDDYLVLCDYILETSQEYIETILTLYHLHNHIDELFKRRIKNTYMRQHIENLQEREWNILIGR